MKPQSPQSKSPSSFMHHNNPFETASLRMGHPAWCGKPTTLRFMLVEAIYSTQEVQTQKVPYSLQEDRMGVVA